MTLPFDDFTEVPMPKSPPRPVESKGTISVQCARDDHGCKGFTFRAGKTRKCTCDCHKQCRCPNGTGFALRILCAFCGGTLDTPARTATVSVAQGAPPPF